MLCGVSSPTDNDGLFGCEQPELVPVWIATFLLGFCCGCVLDVGSEEESLMMWRTGTLFN